MDDNISLSEIKTLLQLLVDELDRQGFIYFEPSSDEVYYNEIAASKMFDEVGEEILPDVGSSIDDIRFLKSDLKNCELGGLANAEHLISVLKMVVNRNGWKESD